MKATVSANFRLKKLTLILCCVLCSAGNAFAYTRTYFDMREDYDSDISAFPKWTRALASMREPSAGGTSVGGPSEDVWQNLPFMTLLNKVNKLGNSHRYIEDKDNWGTNDYWATPEEFEQKNGDCEDYAIYKYYMLRLSGIAADRMRIIVLQDLNLGGVIHAVLGVYDDNGEMYILDNQIKQVMAANRIYHYKPVYGINENGWWAYYPHRK